MYAYKIQTTPLEGWCQVVSSRVISRKENSYRTLPELVNSLSHFLKDFIADYNPIKVSSTCGGVFFCRSHVTIVELGMLNKGRVKFQI